MRRREEKQPGRTHPIRAKADSAAAVVYRPLMSSEPLTDDLDQTTVPHPRVAPVETPWGPVQLVREIAPGIIRYDTASHGGYRLSPERVAAMPKALREFCPWAGPGWYEEDCDWSLVAVAFPQFFPPAAVTAAHDSLRHYRPELHAAVAEHRDSGRGG